MIVMMIGIAILLVILMVMITEAPQEAHLCMMIEIVEDHLQSTIGTIVVPHVVTMMIATDLLQCMMIEIGTDMMIIEVMTITLEDHLHLLEVQEIMDTVVIQEIEITMIVVTMMCVIQDKEVMMIWAAACVMIVIVVGINMMTIGTIWVVQEVVEEVEEEQGEGVEEEVGVTPLYHPQ